MSQAKTPSYNPGTATPTPHPQQIVCHLRATKNPIVVFACLGSLDKSTLIKMLLAELLGSTASVSLRWAGGGCSDRGLGATQKPCALQPHTPATGNPNTAQRQCPSQLPGTLKTAIRNCNEGLGKLVCFYKCNLTKSVLPSQCSSQGWLPGGFFWKAWASSEFKFAASFFQLQQTKCSLSIHTPVNPQLRQVDKSQKNKLMSPSHVSGLRVHIQQMHKGVFFFF